MICKGQGFISVLFDFIVVVKMLFRTGFSGLISADRVFGLLERDFQVRDMETVKGVGQAGCPEPIHKVI